jgi:hypothetical protein
VDTWVNLYGPKVFKRHAVNENLVPCKKHQEKFPNAFRGNLISMNIPHRNEERSSTYFSRVRGILVRPINL